MERTNQKECPKCKSKNIIDSGGRIGDMSKIGPGGPILDANHPIYECKDCGEPTILAEQNLEGYLKISGKLLKKKEGIFAIKAEGSSMNKANINGETIENGDYVIIDSKYRMPDNGDYVLSVIDDVANIKKFIFDKKIIR